jgi:hypothetical protein
MHRDVSQDLEHAVVAYFKAGPRRAKNAPVVWPTCVANSHFIAPRPIRDVMWRSVKNRNRLKGADTKVTVADAIYLLSSLLFLARKLNKSWWQFWLALSFWCGHIRKVFLPLFSPKRCFLGFVASEPWVHTLTEVKTIEETFTMEHLPPRTRRHPLSSGFCSTGRRFPPSQAWRKEKKE